MQSRISEYKPAQLYPLTFGHECQHANLPFYSRCLKLNAIRCLSPDLVHLRSGSLQPARGGCCKGRQPHHCLDRDKLLELYFDCDSFVCTTTADIADELRTTACSRLLCMLATASGVRRKFDNGCLSGHR